MATGFTYLGCPKIGPVLNLHHPTGTHRGVTLFLKPLRRFISLFDSCICQNAPLVLPKRPFSCIVLYAFCHKDADSLRKLSTGCSSRLYYLLLKLPFPFFKNENVHCVTILLLSFRMASNLKVTKKRKSKMCLSSVEKEKPS